GETQQIVAQFGGTSCVNLTIMPVPDAANRSRVLVGQESERREGAFTVSKSASGSPLRPWARTFGRVCPGRRRRTVPRPQRPPCCWPSSDHQAPPCCFGP